MLGALGQPQLRGPHQPRREDELPRVAAARRRLRARRHDGHRPRQRPARRRTRRRRVYLRDIWPTEHEIAQTVEHGRAVGHVPQELRRRLRRRRATGTRLDVPDRRPLRLGRATRPTCASRRTSRACRRARAGHRHRSARACSPCSATASRPTTSRRRARSRSDGPAGALPRASTASSPRDFNSYGSRRGNHEVMMRGTFANIRLRNQLAPGTEGGVTRHLPDGEQMSIYDAVDARTSGEGVPLVVLAGKEYGSGSSRDWAAKGTQPARRARRDRRELRAHPPLEPRRHGRAAAAVRRRARTRRRSGLDRRGDVRDHGPRRAAQRGRAAARRRRCNAGNVEFTGGRAHRHAEGGASTSATAGSCSTCCGSSPPSS